MKLSHPAFKCALAATVCFITMTTLATSKIYAQKKIAKKTKQDKKLKLTTKGLSIGNDVRILPYASLENGFDPYFGLKLEHSDFGDSPDRMFHHFKFESVREFSWKFRYQANSISTKKTKYNFLFKIKSDDDTFFYGVGNAISKSSRALATYNSVFVGGEVERKLSEGIVFRVSAGMWNFRSGLVNGGEFERAADAQYITSRFTLSDSKSIDYWKASIDNQWSGYIEFGLPVHSSVAKYARINLQSMTRFPVFKNSKFGVGTRVEFLISPHRRRMPYFALPEVGSGSGLRGFSKERFRDYALFAVNLEYSIPLSQQLDAFLLSDIAQTAHNLTKFFGSTIHQSFGFGLRLHKGAYPFAVGVAGSNEGVKLFSTIALGRVW
ncbi:MAG: hypothetical protein ACE5I1_27730 [bacterium]